MFPPAAKSRGPVCATAVVALKGEFDSLVGSDCEDPPCHIFGQDVVEVEGSFECEPRELGTSSDNRFDPEDGDRVKIQGTTLCPIRDPYSLNVNGEQTVIGAGSDAYKKILHVGPGGMMGRISIPSIHAELPIFHNTDEETLSRGVGHLFGSALPVGGESTHSVLTGHSGFVNATLFDHPDQVTEGDVFSISTLDETDALRKVQGLVTCTPKGINSHRLLVRGERIDPPSSDSTQQLLPSTTLDPGFPWWALALPVTAALTIRLTRPRSRNSEAPAPST